MPRVVAKHTRSDGTPVVRIDTPTFFTLDEAATALALIYAGEPVRRGQLAVQGGLNQAARERLDTSRGADAAVVDAYRGVLERHREHFFRHTSAAGEPVARFRAPWFFNLEEAARALALVYPEVPARFGQMTVQQGLHQAATDRVWEKPSRVRSLSEAAVETYRAKLVEVGVFPAPSGS